MPSMESAIYRQYIYVLHVTCYGAICCLVASWRIPPKPPSAPGPPRRVSSTPSPPRRLLLSKSCLPLLLMAFYAGSNLARMSRWWGPRSGVGEPRLAGGLGRHCCLGEGMRERRGGGREMSQVVYCTRQAQGGVAVVVQAGRRYWAMGRWAGSNPVRPGGDAMPPCSTSLLGLGRAW